MPGIEQTKDVILAAVALGNSLGKALEDGKVGLSDLPAFIDPMTKLPSALSGISEVPGELADIDESEKAELYAAVKENFNLPDDKIEVAIEDGLALAGAIHSYIKNVFGKKPE